jgi:hypothetical protein
MISEKEKHKLLYEFNDTGAAIRTRRYTQLLRNRREVSGRPQRSSAAAGR